MPAESVLMNFGELALAARGEIRPEGASRTAGFSSVCIDSRKAREGSLFAALPGTVMDGHSFVCGAFSLGAAAALVTRRDCRRLDLETLAATMGRTLIVVEDTLAALQDAATAYLEKYPRLIRVGITGSSGKTTTKEIAAAIVGRKMCVVANPGNYNSETGFPLAAFEVRSEHEVGIFELGISARGEMARLVRILNPQIALVTNVGTAHLGIIGSQRGILEEKKTIFSGLGKNGLALIPEDSPYRDALAEGLECRTAFYGEKSIRGLGGTRSLGLEGSELTIDGRPVRLALPGRHNLANAVAALAVAQELVSDFAAMREGIAGVRPLFARGEVLQGSVTVLKDCYNSNPQSLRAVLDFCQSLDRPGRRMYVIGDMLELGEEAPAAHREAGRLLAASGAELVFLFGREMEAAFAEIKFLKPSGMEVFHTNDMQELIREVGSRKRDGDLVLLKGSRGCQMERLFPVLQEDGDV
ncbi:MAG: UDP-N-acetylmuramoyl-tripeptide--D-alanyl-D-alanine ligase [Treponema sp.]|nr:UDP-N-acetylmuramoyl-tripeptide--D-alanyl-D-alanine ligase [Treponema sp.]